MSESQPKYSRQVRMYKEEYLSVCVYLNVETSGARFYDTVIYRKIKDGRGSFEYKRGTNLKPKDLAVLIRLLGEANEFIVAELGSPAPPTTR